MITKPQNLKEVIANNLTLLMDIYSKSRKEVCADLSLSYTTYCDWLNARTYPRMDALENISHYFRISIQDMLSDLSASTDTVEKLSTYAQKYGTAREDDGTPIFTSGGSHAVPENYPVELINGEYYIYEAPTSIHQHILAELCLFIGHFIKKNHTGHHLYPGPFSVELPTQAETIVVPDISIISNTSNLDEYGYVGVPNWIIEISSPNSRAKDQYLKKQLYEENLVPEYWVIDPYQFEVTVYSLNPSPEPHYRIRSYTFTENISSGVILGLTLRMVDLDIGNRY